MERSPLVYLTLCPNAPAVAGYNPLYYCEANSCPFEFLFAVQALENTKELTCIFHIEAGAVIAYLVYGFGFVLRTLHLDDNLLLARRELDRVREQVHPHLADQRRVSYGRW